MTRPVRRLFLLLSVLPVVVLVCALLYMLGMALLEGTPRGFWQSIGWAAESLTTTGFGADDHWDHPVMVVYVAVVEFAGVFLAYLIIPLFFLPFLEERFETRLPQEASPHLADHVLIYRYGPAVESLLGELDGAGVATLLLEEDDAAARPLAEAGRAVVSRGLSEAALRACHLERARAVIANGSDDANAALTLAVRQLGFTGPILALAEEPFHRRPLMLAGASAVFTPRHILGAALAARASARISPRVAGVQQLGRKLEVAEVRIEPRSPLAGRTLEEADLGARTGATVIGHWVGGRLETQPTVGLRLQADSVLVLAGSHESIDRAGELARGTVGLTRSGRFVVGGCGEVGRKVVELLTAVGEEVRTIDRHPGPGIDLAGDVLDPRLLEQAGMADAQAVILALDTDSATLFATVILKDAYPEVPVIARVNQAENVERIHRAGASFALSISQVSGQMLAKKLLGEEAVSVDAQLKVRRVAIRRLRGHHPADLDVRRRTGCSVVAVERGEELLVEFGPAFRFADGDAVYVCGSAEAVRRFEEGLG